MGYHGTGVNYGGRELDELREPVVYGQGPYGLSQSQAAWQDISDQLRQVGLYVESSMNKNAAAHEGAAADAANTQGLSPLASYAQAAQIQAEFAAEATGNQAEYYSSTRNAMPDHMDRPSLWPDILTPWEYFRKKREYDRRVDRATDLMNSYQSNSNSNISSMPEFVKPQSADIGMAIPQGTQVNPGSTSTTAPTLPSGAGTVTPTSPSSAGGLPGGYTGVGAPVGATPGVSGPGGGIVGPGGGGIVGPGGGFVGAPGSGTGTARPGTGSTIGTARPGTARPGTGSTVGTSRPGTGVGEAGRTGTGRPGTGGTGRPPGGAGAADEVAGRRGTGGYGGRGALGMGEYGPGARGAAGLAGEHGMTGRGAAGLAGRGAAGLAGEHGVTGRGGPGTAGGMRGGGAAGSAFGPMGGARGDEDVEHRRPDYLVETEDIFRDATMVAPPVIGEELPDYYHR